MSAQSVTIRPSQFSPSFTQPVRSSLLACVGIPLIEAELTIKVSAPALRQSLNGRKNFSLNSLSGTTAGVLSLPETGTP